MQCNAGRTDVELNKGVPFRLFGFCRSFLFSMFMAILCALAGTCLATTERVPSFLMNRN